MALLAEVARLVRSATNATQVVVWLRLDGGWSAAASAGSTGPAAPGPPASDLCVAIHDAGEELGVLAIDGATGRSPHVDRLVADLASHAGVVTRSLHLRETLRQRVEIARERHREVTTARARLVTVQDTQRRRLERDIHDTCQQQATLLAGRIGLASTLLQTDPALARDTLCNAAADVERLAAALHRLTSTTSIAELLADGVAPALPAEATGLPVTVAVEDARAGTRVPELESVLYFCAMEGLQNAARHSGASTVHIGISQTSATILLTVRDEEPVRSDRPTTGTGLRNLRERLDPWRGTLTIRSTFSWYRPRGVPARVMVGSMRRVALGLTTLCLATAGTTMLALFAARRPGDLPANVIVPIYYSVPLTLAFAAVAAAILGSRPGHPVGWSLGAVGALAAAGTFAEGYAAWGLRGLDWVIWAWTLLGAPTFAALAASLLLFPTGAPPGPAWRWLGRALVGYVAVAVVVTALAPWPRRNHFTVLFVMGQRDGRPSTPSAGTPRRGWPTSSRSSRR